VLHTAVEKETRVTSSTPTPPPPDQARRQFVKRSVYAAPAILTLAAAPEFAKAGSGKPAGPPAGPPPGKP
jgi:hypothetical protein